MAEKAEKDTGKSKRLRERFALTLPVRVKGRESVDDEWTETSRLVDVTPFGARLRLTRPTEPGRLLHLTLPMPRPLRCYDHVEDQYRVWSLVRNVKLLEPGAAKGAVVEVGLAFVGKRAPRSFKSDPTRRYEIAKSITEGLWSVKEDSGESLSEMSATDKRKDTRHTIPVGVVIELFDKHPDLPHSESTVTENISRLGATVFTTLQVERGQFVKVSSAQHGISVLAAVRGRRAGADGIPRLHLEFISGEWPL